MKAFLIITALLGVHTHTSAEELGAAIDEACAGDQACVLDAVATCYVETRCRMDLCSNRSSACGPFQQIARYADHEGIRNMSITAIQYTLNTDANIAAEQWLIKRNKYRARHGNAWPRRYNGGANADAYLSNWRAVRARAERVAE